MSQTAQEITMTTQQHTLRNKYHFTTFAGGARWDVRYVRVPGDMGFWRASTGDLPYVDSDARVIVTATRREMTAKFAALDADAADHLS